MKRLIFWVTIASGVAAAYMMYRRGESVGTIAKNTVSDPFGSLTSELKRS